jgi:hypothetical protein
MSAWQMCFQVAVCECATVCECICVLLSVCLLLRPGLPDFSWYSKPKWGKNIPNTNYIIKWAQNIPNGGKIFQIGLNCTNIFNLKAPKIYPNWDFWFQNIPSGNPGWGSRRSDNWRDIVLAREGVQLCVCVCIGSSVAGKGFLKAT